MKVSTVVLGLTAFISGALAAAVPAPETSRPGDMQLEAKCAWKSCQACMNSCYDLPCPSNPRQCSTVRFGCLAACGYTGCCSD
ncbi:hypothetical protein CSOJ01_11173 [Colletotrichum sojae]|uniref:Uncharacterized protein n=1 Tax=Colletotrichum sojae TaxID=2175907 RepID=A0A8H6IYZ2_9PEZI|nr:hypothetical protein CSOJ01_11173 [Colletotrichum sojae]